MGKKKNANVDARMREMADAANISQVKYDGKIVTIVYSIHRSEQGNDIYTLKCHEQPTEAFRDALRALKPHVAKMICLTSAEITKQKSAYEIRGVNYKEAGSIPKAQVIVVRQLPIGAALNFNTPLCPTWSEEAADTCLDDDFVEALEAVREQGREYIAGAREQMTLQFPTGEDEGTTSDAA